MTGKQEGTNREVKGYCLWAITDTNKTKNLEKAKIVLTNKTKRVCKNNWAARKSRGEAPDFIMGQLKKSKQMTTERAPPGAST